MTPAVESLRDSSSGDATYEVSSSSIDMRKQADDDGFLRRRSAVDEFKTGVATMTDVADGSEGGSSARTTCDRAESKETVMVGYWRSLAINFVAFLLPSAYIVLSKLWIAQLDPNVVALTDTFQYLGVLAEALNQGLPRVAWRIIADRRRQSVDERYGLAYTMLLFQTGLALVLLAGTCIGATSFATGFVPAAIRAQSAFYVRLTSISTACSVINAALSTSTRALDHPDVPLVLAAVKTAVNIILDLLLLSPFRPLHSDPSVNTQAIVRACCDVCATCVSVAMFVIKQKREVRCYKAQWQDDKTRPSIAALKKLVKVAVWYQAEALPRTAIDLWFSSLVVSLGSQWATAFGIFFTIRVGIGFVPLLAVEASCQTHTGHSWALVAAQRQREEGDPDRREKHLRLKVLFRSVAISTLIICVVEAIMYLSVGFGFGRALAFYLSDSEPIADLTVHIWLLIDWGYMFVAMFFQISSVILIARPDWYLYQSLVVVVFFSLPATIGFWHALDDQKTRIVWFVAYSAGSCFMQFLSNLVWTSVYVRNFS